MDILHCTFLKGTIKKVTFKKGHVLGFIQLCFYGKWRFNKVEKKDINLFILVKQGKYDNDSVRSAIRWSSLKRRNVYNA